MLKRYAGGANREPCAQKAGWRDKSLEPCSQKASWKHPSASWSTRSANPVPQKPKKVLRHTMDPKSIQNMVKNRCFEGVFGRLPKTENSILSNPGLKRHTGKLKVSNPVLKRQAGEPKVSNPVFKRGQANPKSRTLCSKGRLKSP